MNEKLTIEGIKRRIGEKWSSTKQWCRDHQGEIIVFGLIVGGVIVEVIETVTKAHVVSQKKALKDRYIYDRDAGHYYELKRKPKSSEWITIDELRKNNDNENLGEILRDMRLLK